MGVIVKGMKMPTCCEWCEVENFKKSSYGFIIDSWCPAISNEPSTLKIRRESRHSLCPLQPLPEKHGRLIEADSLKETLDYYIREAGWDEKTNQVLGWVKDEFIDSEPTIVEAEGD